MPIVLDNVTFTYSPDTPFERTAVKDCSLRIENGEFLAIIGHTGSGKTTLTQLMNGLLLPDKNKGTVTVDGELLTKKTAVDIRRKVGYVFQYPEHQLFEETVYKDIAFGLKRFKLSAEEEDKKIRRAAELVGLSEELLERSIYELSGGEKRRVAISGVIVSEPDYLILDEPASGLDPAGKNDILNFMKRMNEMGKTVIFISHSMDDVAENAKRVVVINEGNVAMDGTVSDVFSQFGTLRGYGLDVPELNKLFFRLNQRFPFVNPNVFTLKEAREEIRRLTDEGRLVF